MREYKDAWNRAERKQVVIVKMCNEKNKLAKKMHVKRAIEAARRKFQKARSGI